MIPSLKVAGLGLTGIIPDKKEEDSVEKTISKKPSVPNLHIKAAKASTMTSDALPTPNREEVKKEESAPPQMAKPKIPSLKIGGLGITGLKLEEKDEAIN